MPNNTSAEQIISETDSFLQSWKELLGETTTFIQESEAASRLWEANNATYQSQLDAEIVQSVDDVVEHEDSVE